MSKSEFWPAFWLNATFKIKSKHNSAINKPKHWVLNCLGASRKYQTDVSHSLNEWKLLNGELHPNGSRDRCCGSGVKQLVNKPPPPFAADAKPRNAPLVMFWIVGFFTVAFYHWLVVWTVCGLANKGFNKNIHPTFIRTGLFMSHLFALMACFIRI